jgi:hypothetical protein
MLQSESEALLVFVGKLISDYDDDAERTFSVNYYLATKEIAIFEKKGRGIAGGKFLAKMKVKNPATGKDYDDNAFYVGAQITAAGRIFELVDAPEYTLCQLEANSNRFPEADLQKAVDALKGRIGASAVNDVFAVKDPSNTGQVPAADAQKILYGIVPTITKQAAITLLRRFTEGGAFNYGELVGYVGA